MITVENSVMNIAGAVDNATAPALLFHALKQVNAGVSYIDLKQVERVDSSGVSLLLHLQREAMKLGRKLHVQNVPSNLQALIHLYDLDETLCPLAQ